MKFKDITNSVSDFFKSDRGKSVLKWGQRIVNLAILIWLFYQLSTIGWLKVWQSLPTQALFYVLFVVLFFQLPLFEVLIYRLTWTFNMVKSIPVFMLKQVYNKDVLGYSGELYFFVWAKKTLHKSGTEIFKTIKDNNIISSVASTFITIGLLAAFLFSGQIKILTSIANQNQTYFWGGSILLVVIVLLFIKFRHFVISMPLKTAYKIFGLQFFRLLLGQAINLLMYIVVLPSIPFYIWFTFIAVDIILSRIPFLPNRDLISAAMIIKIAGGLPIAKVAIAGIAGIVIAKGVLNKIGSLVAFGLANLSKQSNVVADPKENLTALEEFEDRV